MDAKNIFKPFMRLSGRPDSTSTGMNLAISERMISAHKGKMWVESLTARGAKFYISLPKR